MGDNIYSELLHRFKMPWCNSFAMYFIIVIVLFGSVGVWLPLLKESPFSVESLAINIITYACALIIPAAVSIILSMKDYKNKISLVLFIVAILLAVAFFVGYSVFKGNLCTSIICCILSLLFWVIANCDNEQLSDDKYNKSIKSNSNKLSENWK